MSDAANVTAAKPKVGGAVYVAATDTTLPTDATTELSDDFACLGYISSDGVKNNSSVNVETTKAWGGDVVLVTNNGREDTFGLKLIEGLNTDVLKYVYGDDNVSGDLSTGIVINVNGDDMDYKAIVIDTILNGGALKRMCIPQGAITSIGAITYVDNSPVGYDVTVTCIADDAGNTHYEYISDGTTSTE